MNSSMWLKNVLEEDCAVSVTSQLPVGRMRREKRDAKRLSSFSNSYCVCMCVCLCVCICVCVCMCVYGKDAQGEERCAKRLSSFFN